MVWYRGVVNIFSFFLAMAAPGQAGGKRTRQRHSGAGSSGEDTPRSNAALLGSVLGEIRYMQPFHVRASFETRFNFVYDLICNKNGEFHKRG